MVKYKFSEDQNSQLEGQIRRLRAQIDTLNETNQILKESMRVKI